jgi:hypothetical protein
MESENINPMDKEEFEVYTRKIIDALGDDISGFFTIIHDTFQYFVDSDAVIEKTQISLEEFDMMIKKITNILGKEESVRFFKAVYDAMPKKTITYLGLMVKVFESFINQ